ncbi:hypothetical protein K450DRAFT_219626 [Umbelopsis ramanniana AG]|uniref:Calcium-activated potassium channel BK alpha subunit domain-containing protein n=1 Tax=Umbelopsis ramanniana AG TaxID=1314678 RepID=A0AAD5HH87_UMBRA|nr:uncharacterized protein K450DRAFT_219626 [Umbelopsis ramanniana AG]KAI8584387.1 hypothetical protein K450DRAFT_219626 [Umbelopsis ramanniana AG]
MGTSVPVGVKSKQLRNMYKTPYLAQRGNIHDLDMLKPTKTMVRSESTTFKRHKHRVTWREKVAFWMDTSKGGRNWELLDAFLSLLFVIIYIWNTQYVKKEPKVQPLPKPAKIFELAIAVGILAQYLPRVVIAPQPHKEMVSPYSILTFIATVPVMIAFVLSTYEWKSSIDEDIVHTYMSAGPLVFLYPLRFVRLHMSVGRCLLPVKHAVIHISLIARKALQLGTTILFTILTVTAFIHVFTFKQHVQDPKFESMTFYNAFFFTVVSSVSSIRTDIVPDNEFTRLVILYVMIAGALYIPTRLAELLSLIQHRSKYRHSYRSKDGQQHVIVTGSFEPSSLLEFLREFFCEDHGMDVLLTKVVVLCPYEPSEELNILLNDPSYASRVQYVKGSATSFHHLNKARADVASAAFLLSSKLTHGDQEREDAQQLTRALTMRKYNRHLKLYVQTHLPENVVHFDFIARSVICVEEYNMGLLAQSALIPGFSSLLLLLTTSLTEKSCGEMLSEVKGRSDMNWMRDYLDGAGNEVYPVKFSPMLTGKPFLQVAEIIYAHSGSQLFAIGKKMNGLTSLSSSYCVSLNPKDYIIRDDDVGYIISESSNIADYVRDFGFRNNTLTEYHSLLENGVGTYGGTSTSTLINIAAENRNPSNSVVNEESADVDALKVKSSLVYDPIESDDDHSSIGQTEQEAQEAVDALLGGNGGTSPGFKRSGTVTPSNEQMLDHRQKLTDANVKYAKQHAHHSTFASLPAEVEDHLLVCDVSQKFPRNIEILVGSVRAKEKDRPVVIMCFADPNPEQRARLHHFQNVHIIKGRPTLRKDLYRAGVERMWRCIVLSDKSASSSDVEEFADASGLLTALNVESMSDETGFIVVECLERETFKMIGMSETIQCSEEVAQAMLRPSFMSGNVYTSSMLDTIICQCYYNTHLRDVLSQLIFSHNPDTQNAYTRLCEGPEAIMNSEENDSSYGSSGHVYQIEVPPVLHGTDYLSLVRTLIRQHAAIPLGLYRTVLHQGAPTSFVYVNPQRDSTIKQGDCVYVIADDDFQL